MTISHLKAQEPHWGHLHNAKSKFLSHHLILPVHCTIFIFIKISSGRVRRITMTAARPQSQLQQGLGDTAAPALAARPRDAHGATVSKTRARDLVYTLNRPHSPALYTLYWNKHGGQCKSLKSTSSLLDFGLDVRSDHKDTWEYLLWHPQTTSCSET